MTTEEKKTRTPRVTAKVKTTIEQPVATEAVVAKTPRKRTSRTAKEQVVSETPVVKEPVVKTIQEDDTEEVIKAVEKSVVVQSVSDAIADELHKSKNEVKLQGSTDYTIGKESFSIAQENGNADNKYPMGIWARDPFSLGGLQSVALRRIIDDEGTDADYTTVDFAEQNAVNLDPQMASFFARPGARWNNYLPVGARRLRNSSAVYKPGNIDGNTDRVVAALMRKLEIGNPMIVRFWHSGLVFSINPPDKAERIAMTDRLNAAHLATLRRTNGLIHGTSAYYANRIIINEFMRHVTAANIERSLWDEIYELLDHRDIQFMALGIMGSSHPRGYKLVETCGGLKNLKNADGTDILKEDGTPKKTICGHISEDIIDFKLLTAIDDSMFTDWQRDFIARPLDENKPVSREDILKYQSEGDIHKVDTIMIDDEFGVILGAPKAGLHIEIGEEWISSVEQAVNDVIGVAADDDTRSEYINKQLEATASLDVAHWVTGFWYGGEEIKDRAGINKIFRSLGNNEKLRDDLFERIRGGMIKRLGAVPAVPTFTCVSCGTLSNVIQNNGTAFYTPIDMVARFFIQTARSQ